jgi:ribosome-associated translation inhibitor RaiA
MRYRFHHIESALRERVEDHVREKAGTVEARLGSFQEDLIQLDVRLDHRKKRYGERRDASYFDGHLVLHLPGEHLPNIGATGHGETWSTAINKAFDDLEDQLEKQLAELHDEPDIHDFQHRPSWEREGAELLGRPQVEPEDPDRWMEEWDREHRK